MNAGKQACPTQNTTLMQQKSGLFSNIRENKPQVM